MTICAISSPAGVGGIAVIRISGPDAIAVTGRLFRPAHASHGIESRPSHSLTYGQLADIDDVVVSLYRAPHSFTGEDVVEISCHGSLYVQQAILDRLVAEGCRIAEPGEFTRRAFANGRMDLTQAEAVADLIASTGAAAHRLAIGQLRGGISHKLAQLRAELVELSSLLELELDFSEEDVEFADRTRLVDLADRLHRQITTLASSFHTGDAIRHGIPTAIVGETNAGKSTLLNSLTGDDRAIVSDLHGTTRDVIEDTFTLGGQQLRIIDTAGLRKTSDPIETIGIERALQQIDRASIILWMVDGSRLDADGQTAADALRQMQPHLHEGQHLLVAVNKTDLLTPPTVDSLLARLQQAVSSLLAGQSLTLHVSYCALSARTGAGMEQLRDQLQQAARLPEVQEGDVVVTNVRHYQALQEADINIVRARKALVDGLSGDLVAQDLRQCAYHLGSIVGAVTSQEVLHSIFSRFCIGK